MSGDNEYYKGLDEHIEPIKEAMEDFKLLLNGCSLTIEVKGSGPINVYGKRDHPDMGKVNGTKKHTCYQLDDLPTIIKKAMKELQ